MSGAGIDQAVRCKLCPKECVLAPGQRGDCRSRINYQGKLITLVYGKAVTANTFDPVEKKPLFHFLPGTRCFSIATAGCNLHCKFCQNFEISQLNPEDAPRVYDLPPDQVVQAAISNRLASIAYTYSEPMTFFEYTRDTQALARQQGLKNILVTAGYLNEAPLRELIANTDAVNMDIKAMSEDFYRDVCDATLAPVLRNTEIMHEQGLWLELTNLIVTGFNDSPDLIRRLCDWVTTKLGPDVPLHFSRFRPLYQLAHLAPTPTDTLASARQTALAMGIRYAYVGNVDIPGGGDTICPSCHQILISRQGYMVTAFNLNDGKCPQCGTAIAGVWK
jgi:pyruvate formate lyase activating enzyme